MNTKRKNQLQWIDLWELITMFVSEIDLTNAANLEVWRTLKTVHPATGELPMDRALSGNVIQTTNDHSDDMRVDFQIHLPSVFWSTASQVHIPDIFAGQKTLIKTLF